jgi:hypothetical protein
MTRDTFAHTTTELNADHSISSIIIIEIIEPRAPGHLALGRF